MIDYDELANRHAYHPPANEGIVKLHELIRQRTLDLAVWLKDNLPDSSETDQALTDVDNAMLHANAAVARHMNG